MNKKLNLEIRKIDFIRFKSKKRGLAVSTTGYAFYCKNKGYIAFKHDLENSKHENLPYQPSGEKVTISINLEKGF